MDELEYQSLMLPSVLLAETNAVFTQNGFTRVDERGNKFIWSSPKDGVARLIRAIHDELTIRWWALRAGDEYIHPTGSRILLMDTIFNDTVRFKLHLHG